MASVGTLRATAASVATAAFVAYAAAPVWHVAVAPRMAMTLVSLVGG